MSCLFRPARAAFVLSLLPFSQGQSANTTPLNRYRWPGAVIPYVIDSNIPRPERIYTAMGQWTGLTPIRLVPRTSQTNYVRFVRVNAGGLCLSAIGMIGGEQKIQTDDRCEAGTLAHEIGHAVGLWHEQSRRDRDRFVRVIYQNIPSQSARDFDRRTNDEPDFSPYDYDSIMHYRAFGDCNERGPSLETIPPGIPIGQRERLSLGDIDTVRRMYGFLPEATTVATHVGGLRIIVDRVAYMAPQRFAWKQGTRHSIEVPPVQFHGDTRYEFGRWNDDGQIRHTITASTEQTIYTANFIPQEEYQVARRASSKCGGNTPRGLAALQP